MKNHPLLQALETVFITAGNPEIAAGQAAYMRYYTSHLGIQKPLRARLEKECFKRHPLSSERELIEILTSLWDKKEREYHYTAMVLAYNYRKIWSPSILDTFEQMIRTKSWWDTVDTTASKLVGHLLLQYPELQKIMDRWIDDSNKWIRRTALIYQLGYKKETDTQKLFSYCKKTLDEEDFFIRKAIGWALRQYSKTNPEEVRNFIDAHDLAPLSKREASKYC